MTPYLKTWHHHWLKLLGLAFRYQTRLNRKQVLNERQVSGAAKSRLRD